VNQIDGRGFIDQDGVYGIEYRFAPTAEARQGM